MNDNEIITTEEMEDTYEEVENTSSHNGLKTAAGLAIAGAIGTGLFFGVKKLVKVIKNKKRQKKYIANSDEVAPIPEVDEDED